MLNAYQLRLKYKIDYRSKVVSFFGHPVYKPRRDKTCHLGFRSRKTQTGVYRHKYGYKLEILNLVRGECTNHEAKPKALIRWTVTK